MTTLSPTVRADLGDVAVPFEGSNPVDTCVVPAPGGWRVAWMHDGGLRKQAFGATYTNPFEASAASAFLRERSFGPAK